MKGALTISVGALTAALLAMPALAQSADHSGHDMSGMDMPGMDMSGMAHRPADSPRPEPPPSPAASSGPAYAADRYFPDGQMAHARKMMIDEMGGVSTTLFTLDRLEWRSGKDGDSGAWEGGLRSGGDIDRLWIKTEGEADQNSGIEEAEIQALWSHAIDPWFDLQAGVRQQLLHGRDRTQLVVGVQGLAPYMFEVSTAAFLSTQGEWTAKFEADIDQHLTQRLILQPRLEANLSAQDIGELGLGSGVTSLNTGMRLRYEIRRELAPYVGVEWQKQFGRTASLTRASGGTTDRVVTMIGLRVWF